MRSLESRKFEVSVQTGWNREIIRPLQQLPVRDFFYHYVKNKKRGHDNYENHIKRWIFQRV